MGSQSIRANKNIYQICREECELTRERASEMMTGVSASRIEKIEYNLQSMTDDYIMMAHTTIDRISLEYNSKSTMTYDNPMFGVRRSTSQGVCKFLN